MIKFFLNKIRILNVEHVWYAERKGTHSNLGPFFDFESHTRFLPFLLEFFLFSWPPQPESIGGLTFAFSMAIYLAIILF